MWPLNGPCFCDSGTLRIARSVQVAHPSSGGMVAIWKLAQNGGSRCIQCARPAAPAQAWMRARPASILTSVRQLHWFERWGFMLQKFEMCPRRGPGYNYRVLCPVNQPTGTFSTRYGWPLRQGSRTRTCAAWWSARQRASAWNMVTATICTSHAVPGAWLAELGSLGFRDSSLPCRCQIESRQP
jgi:hypothetical protein